MNVIKLYMEAIVAEVKRDILAESLSKFSNSSSKAVLQESVTIASGDVAFGRAVMESMEKLDTDLKRKVKKIEDNGVIYEIGRPMSDGDDDGDDVMTLDGYDDYEDDDYGVTIGDDARNNEYEPEEDFSDVDTEEDVDSEIDVDLDEEPVEKPSKEKEAPSKDKGDTTKARKKAKEPTFDEARVQEAKYANIVNAAMEEYRSNNISPNNIIKLAKEQVSGQSSQSGQTAVMIMLMSVKYSIYKSIWRAIGATDAGENAITSMSDSDRAKVGKQAVTSVLDLDDLTQDTSLRFIKDGIANYDPLESKWNTYATNIARQLVDKTDKVVKGKFINNPSKNQTISDDATEAKYPRWYKGVAHAKGDKGKDINAKRSSVYYDGATYALAPGVDVLTAEENQTPPDKSDNWVLTNEKVKGFSIDGKMDKSGEGGDADYHRAIGKNDENHDNVKYDDTAQPDVEEYEAARGGADDVTDDVANDIATMFLDEYNEKFGANEKSPFSKLKNDLGGDNTFRHFIVTYFSKVIGNIMDPNKTAPLKATSQVQKDDVMLDKLASNNNGTKQQVRDANLSNYTDAAKRIEKFTQTNGSSAKRAIDMLHKYLKEHKAEVLDVLDTIANTDGYSRKGGHQHGGNRQN